MMGGCKCKFTFLELYFIYYIGTKSGFIKIIIFSGSSSFFFYRLVVSRFAHIQLV